MPTTITKSEGTTKTEKLLASLCEQSFLKLWSYPNPYKEDGDELCDLLVVYGNDAFVFFDREKVLDYSNDNTPEVIWKRWVRKVIDAQIRTAKGAEKYLKSGRSIFLDSKNDVPFPVEVNHSLLTVHKFIVAHGAKDACLASSDKNQTGSLAISYGNNTEQGEFPYLIHLDETDLIHVLDSESLPIVLGELDTITDFHNYIKEKEQAIKNYHCLVYCGEEDLLAHYFLNFDNNSNKHIIGSIDEEFDGVYIGEGEWVDFIASDTYKKTKDANKISYLWDELLQITSHNALKGTLTGNANVLQGRSAIFEMAKEPRFSRRALCEYMDMVIQKFPKPTDDNGIMRHVAFMPSFYPNRGYVYLQFHAPVFRAEKDYREKRAFILEIACAAAKIKFPDMDTIVGIGMDAPKYAEENEEDFILLDCSEWTREQESYYSELNEDLRFFQTGKHSETMRHITEFI